MAKKYRTKTIEIEAMQVQKENLNEVCSWASASLTNGLIEGTLLHLPTGYAHVGDWVVKRDGAFLAMTDTNFKKIYEEVKAEKVVEKTA